MNNNIDQCIQLLLQAIENNKKPAPKLITHPATIELRRRNLNEEQANKQRLTEIGKARLRELITDKIKSVVVAELREDTSDFLSDYYSSRCARTVILKFSESSRDSFAELRKCALNLSDTAYLSAANSTYEHRENFSQGRGNYLSKGDYNDNGWIVKKMKIFNNDASALIDILAMTASDDNNICIKSV